jgi:polyisoprenoid-binding protein YceI
MKLKAVLGLVMVMAMMSSAPLLSANYVIDREGQHANVNFRASHLGFSYITGRFNDFEGSFSHDPSNPSASKVSVTIKTISLDTNHAERDKTLRSDEFFDVAKYPTITFESTGYMAGSSGDKLKGDLTIHGVTREVSIDVKQVGEGPDPWGGYRSGFEGSVNVTASDYDLPEWVGDIEISLNVEGVRQ